MKKFYFPFQILFFIGCFCFNKVSAQLTATSTGYESRCAATGAIKIVATGGSGSYQYKVQGPVNTSFTSLDSITGLKAGSYTVIVNDINTNATFTQSGVAVTGNYQDPNFNLYATDVSCDNGSNGSLNVGLVLNGRSPFLYTIIAPSPMNVGVSNSTGVFTGLMAGNYHVQMTDSCGAIQTRNRTILNYTWNISSYNFTKTDCDHATGYIRVTDSKGNNSQFTSIPGFSYGAVRSPGDTIWSADGNFNNITVTGINSIDVFAKDGCGNIKKVTLSIFLKPSVNNSVTISNKTCIDFTAKVTGITNFFGVPQFCLYDANNVQIGACNSTGIFNNIPYGSYTITAHDACTGTTIVRSFSVSAPVLSVGNNVVISNKTCATFSASITGQQNLTNPTYCLVNSGGTNISCNSTGVFNNIPTDASYCITTKDSCVDTTITRCFTVNKPIPKVDPVILPAYITCTNFGLNLNNNSDSITNPTYCLYDNNNVLVGPCNNTGIFDSIPFGDYCVTIHDACRDTTIKRCFNVSPPVIVNDININFTNKACTTFTANVTTSNLSNPNFCLYKASDSSLITCNTTGVFPNLNYGDYYVKSTNSCPDTTMVNSFSASRPLPSVNPNVKITNKTCTTFTGEITGQQNLISPMYCLINAITNDTLGCITNPKADSIPYGSYIVRIISACNDIINVPFSQYPDTLSLDVTASRSCNLGYSIFNINVNGNLPVTIKIYTPGGSLIKDSVFNTANFTIDNIPALDSTDKYTIIGTNNCGFKDTVYLAPVVSYLNHTPSVTPKCPGSVWFNGSGDINTTVTSNLPNVTVTIIDKNGTTVSIGPDYVSGSVYSFYDQGPGTYVVRYRSSSCSVIVYDTVTIPPYKYPQMIPNPAYQCDINGFSVGAVVTDGVGPFTYEIIGSDPSTPSIIAPPQANPIFTINNGNTYSLVRLRATDACGNATLTDVSVLPLADNGINSTDNCLLNPTTLSVDTIYNATYSWFLKHDGSTDSVAVSNGVNYYIPNILPSDTGVYVCHVSVNSGCIKRSYYYHLDGSCGVVLPITLIDFSGKFINEKVQLNWAINNTNDLEQIIIERKTNAGFAEIGKVTPHLPSENNQYQFFDPSPGSQNLYRLKLVKKDNTFSYSNIIFLQKQVTSGVTVYPNPVNDMINVYFYNSSNHTYKISLINILNQKLKEIIFNTGNGNKLQIKRAGNISAGIYILQFIDMNTNEEFSQKIIFGQK
jgi:hypothetical protein